MHRRTVLARLGAAGTALFAGCLSHSQPPASDFDGDPSTLVDVHEYGIPRDIGSDLFELDRERIAYVVDSRSDADRVFDHEEIDDEAARAANRDFVDQTDFDSEVLLQIEEKVPDSAYLVEVTGFELQGRTLVVEYEDMRDESVGGGNSAVGVLSELLRVDVERGGIDAFELRHPEASFEPRPLWKLS